jgi:hypothetical protein
MYATVVSQDAAIDKRSEGGLHQFPQIEIIQKVDFEGSSWK